MVLFEFSWENAYREHFAFAVIRSYRLDIVKKKKNVYIPVRRSRRYNIAHHHSEMETGHFLFFYLFARIAFVVGPIPERKPPATAFRSRVSKMTGRLLNGIINQFRFLFFVFRHTRPRANLRGALWGQEALPFPKKK